MKKFCLLIIALVYVVCASAQTRIDTLVNVLHDPNSRRVLVVSHRGDWRNAPENSLQAFQNCIDIGVDMIELDLKKTKDGVLVLMHDNTIDRTTDGHGKPSDYTLAELQKFHLKNGLGRATFHHIPTLEEVLLQCKDKILINIDKGYEYFADVYKLLVKTGTLKQVVIKSGYILDKVRSENGDVLDKVIYMPIINLDEAGAEQKAIDYTKIKPVAMECCFRMATLEVLSLMKRIKDSGSKIWINSLWPSLNAGHDDDTAVELSKPDDSWGWILDSGASIIQTDRPQKLIEYLKTKQRR